MRRLFVKKMKALLGMFHDEYRHGTSRCILPWPRNLFQNYLPALFPRPFVSTQTPAAELAKNKLLSPQRTFIKNPSGRYTTNRDKIKKAVYMSVKAP